MYRATETFHTGVRTITAGDLLDDNDPLVKACTVYFEPVNGRETKATRPRRAPSKSATKKAGN